MPFEMSKTRLPAGIDEALAGAAYEPEDVALLDSAFVRACDQVAQRFIVGEGLRSLLACAVLEGAKSGLRDPEQLAAFALRALPSFRAQEPKR